MMRLNTAFVALVASTVLTSAAAAQTVASESQRAMLGPMADVLLTRVGTWDVRADLRLQPNARPVSIKATATSKLIGNRWLVTELQGVEAKGMPRFEGLGVNGFDAGAGKYVGYWVDGSRGIAIPVSGTYDPKTAVFTTSSIERNRDGSTTSVRSETKRTSPDTEVTTFTATDAKGRSFVRMLLTYTRSGRAQSAEARPGEGGHP
jgi:hypothetical protein